MYAYVSIYGIGLGYLAFYTYNILPAKCVSYPDFYLESSNSMTLQTSSLSSFWTNFKIFMCGKATQTNEGLWVPLFIFSGFYVLS